MPPEKREHLQFRVTLHDGRVQCARCHSTAVYDPALARQIFDETVGAVVEMLGARRGRMMEMQDAGQGMTRMVYIAPTRGLLGFRYQFLTSTRGAGVMHTIFHSYDEMAGPMSTRTTGSLVAWEAGETTAYALKNAEERGTLFLGCQPSERKIGSSHKICANRATLCHSQARAGRAVAEFARTALRVLDELLEVFGGHVGVEGEDARAQPGDARAAEAAVQNPV